MAGQFNACKRMMDSDDSMFVPYPGITTVAMIAKMAITTRTISLLKTPRAQ